ncbi:MAG: hypothetical protein CBARDMAM_2473 [uncultured Caballeronia sp.]|nr:MAG: hypothetical protein CBARDMAM_2473 [uncultured Caballeronia sp.]
MRFHGLIRETEGAAVEPFIEIWNLSKQKYGNELVAGRDSTGQLMGRLRAQRNRSPGCWRVGLVAT